MVDHGKATSYGPRQAHGVCPRPHSPRHFSASPRHFSDCCRMDPSGKMDLEVVGLAGKKPG